MQDFSNSSANAQGLLLSWTKPSIFSHKLYSHSIYITIFIHSPHLFISTLHYAIFLHYIPPFMYYIPHRIPPVVYYIPPFIHCILPLHILPYTRQSWYWNMILVLDYRNRLSWSLHRNVKHWDHVHGLIQDCGISSVLAMELVQPCTKPPL